MNETTKNILSKVSGNLKKKDIDVISLSDPDVGAIVNHRIKTSSHLFNYILGGGIPCGRLTEIFGEESNGKSSIAADIISSVQKQGGVAVIIDSEHCFSPTRAQAMGVDTDDVIYSDEVSVEGVFELMENLIDQINETEVPAVIIWDSVGAASTKKELQGDIEDKTPAEKAKLLSKGIKRVTDKINNKTALIFLNQVRTKFNVSFGDHTEAVGGFAIRYHASIRIKLSRIGKHMVQEKPIGIKIRAYTVKNKTFPPFKSCEFDMMFGGGIDDTNSLLDLLVTSEVVHQSGVWYDIPGVGKKFNRKDFKSVLQELPNKDELIQKAMSNL